MMKYLNDFYHLSCLCTFLLYWCTSTCLTITNIRNKYYFLNALPPDLSDYIQIYACIQLFCGLWSSVSTPTSFYQPYTMKLHLITNVSHDPPVNFAFELTHVSCGTGLDVKYTTWFTSNVRQYWRMRISILLSLQSLPWAQGIREALWAVLHPMVSRIEMSA